MTTADHRDFEFKDFEKADEVRPFTNGRLELLHIGGSDIGRLVLQPGWRWSESVKPFVGTELCEEAHFLYQVSGRMRVRMRDGNEFESVPGQVSVIPPGHDAWVIGDEQAVAVDWRGAAHYAERAGRHDERS